MLRLVVGNSTTSPLDGLIDALNQHREADVMAVCQTGRDATDALRVMSLDAFVFPAGWAELCRAIRVSGESPRDSISFIMASNPVTPSLTLKTLLYGFDGIVTSNQEAGTIVADISRIVDGTSSLFDNPMLNELGISHGLMSRELMVNDPADREVANLVAAGLPDEDIARLTGESVQRTRNRVERLMTSNGLAYRTQLAVLSASVWRVPDFN